MKNLELFPDDFCQIETTPNIQTEKNSFTSI